MKPYYFTTASNHPGGSGYWEVYADNATDARVKMHHYFESKWAFQYEQLDHVHEYDRAKKHGIIL